MTPPGRRHAGFAYLWLLLFVALAGFGLASIATVWHTGVQREKEVQLLFIGDQFRRALDSYYALAPKQLPVSLDELLADQRFPQTVRHLRRIYADPMTGKPDWGMVKSGDRIVGVYSTAAGTPLKRAGFESRYAQFATAENYSGWVFRIDVPAAAARATGGTAADEGGAPGAATVENPRPALPRARCDLVYESEVERCYSEVLDDASNRACEAAALRIFDSCLAQPK